MTKKTFKTGRGYRKADWDAVDSPPATRKQLAQAKPFAEALPALAAEMRRVGRPRLEKPKQPVYLRLDADVVEKFKATGRGWQSKMNAVLKRAKVT